jgi:hypothetical protein
MASRFTATAAGVLAFALLVTAAPAPAKDGEGDRSEARVPGTCSKGATSTLRLRSRNGTIRAEFEVKRRRAREVWRVVLVHERRIEWRGTIRTHESSGSFRIRRSLKDLDGPDEVVARASGRRGIKCEASATLRG